MADYKLNKTGQQIDTLLTKANDLANIKSVGSGLELSSGGVLSATASGGVSSIGGSTGAITLGTGLTMTGNELSASGGGGTQLYKHTLRSSVLANTELYIITSYGSPFVNLQDLYNHQDVFISVGSGLVPSNAPSTDIILPNKILGIQLEYDDSDTLYFITLSIKGGTISTDELTSNVNVYRATYYNVNFTDTVTPL